MQSIKSMEGAENLFADLSDTVKNNFVPIVIILVLVLLLIGWLVYKSFSSPSKNENFEPNDEQDKEEDNSEETNEHPEQAPEDENTSSE
jgi:flagellar basal body-associated protein FliL